MLAKHYLAFIILESLIPWKPGSVTASPVVSLGLQMRVTTELLRNASDPYTRAFPITLLELPICSKSSDLKSGSLLAWSHLWDFLSSISAMAVWHFCVTRVGCCFSQASKGHSSSMLVLSFVVWWIIKSYIMIGCAHIDKLHLPNLIFWPPVSSSIRIQSPLSCIMQPVHWVDNSISPLVDAGRPCLVYIVTLP